MKEYTSIQIAENLVDQITNDLDSNVAVDIGVLSNSLRTILNELEINAEPFTDKSEKAKQFKKILRNSISLEHKNIIISVEKLKNDLKNFKASVASAKKDVPLSSDKSKSEKVIVSAYGDGNCAFNAFALGLCDLIMQGKLDHYSADRKNKIFKLFSDSFEGIEIKNFDELRKFIMNFNNKDQLIELQQILAPKLRATVQNILKDKTETQNEYRDLTLQALLTAYDDYIKSDASTSEGDDIFRRHKFILEQFQQIKEKKSGVETAKVNLTKWWNETGFLKFNSEMNKNSVYAGDIELGILSRHFMIEVYATRKDNLETPLLQNKNMIDPSISAVSLRNEVVHWNYEAEGCPEWLASLIVENDKKQDSKNPTKLYTDAPKASDSIGKWAKDAALKLLNKVCKGKKIEPKDDGSFGIKHKTDEINVSRTGSTYQITTDSRDRETLLESVRILAEIAKELNAEDKNHSKVVVIDEPDAAIRKTLVEECQRLGLKIKGFQEKANEEIDDNDNTKSLRR